MRERGPRGARIEFLGPRWDTPKFFTRSFGAHQTTKSGDHGRLPSGSGQKEWPGAHRRVKAWSLGVVLRVCHGAQADHPRGVFISDQRPPTGHQLQRACATTLHLATMCARHQLTTRGRSPLLQAVPVASAGSPSRQRRCWAQPSRANVRLVQICRLINEITQAPSA